jgi:hypothetical protein
MKTDIEEFRKAFTVADARQKKLDELRLSGTSSSREC